jgi:hypothetical protein
MLRIIQAGLVVGVLFCMLPGEARAAKEHPKQVKQIAREMKALLKLKQDGFLTISEVGTDRVVQISKTTLAGKSLLSLNIGFYPSQQEPSKALPAAGIKIRKGWSQSDFEAGTYAQYDIPVEDGRYMAYIIHKIFTKFYKAMDDYKLDIGFDVIPTAAISEVEPAPSKTGASRERGVKELKTARHIRDVAFRCIRTVATVNDTVTELRVSNLDANMAQHTVRLDERGQELAKAEGMVFRISGVVQEEGGERMLVIKEFKRL